MHGIDALLALIAPIRAPIHISPLVALEFKHWEVRPKVIPLSSLREHGQPPQTAIGPVILMNPMLVASLQQ